MVADWLQVCMNHAKLAFATTPWLYDNQVFVEKQVKKSCTTHRSSIRPSSTSNLAQQTRSTGIVGRVNLGSSRMRRHIYFTLQRCKDHAIWAGQRKVNNMLLHALGITALLCLP